LFLRASPGLGPSWGYLALEGHRSFIGAPPSLPRVHSAVPSDPLEALLPYPWPVPWPRSKTSLLPSLVGKVTPLQASGILLQDIQSGNSPAGKVLKNNTFTYLTLGSKALRGKGNGITQMEYIIPETWKMN